MVNFLQLILNPQIKHESQFEILRDFRKGGLNPTNYDDFISEVKKLPPITKITTTHLIQIAKKFNLSDLTEEDFFAVQRELIKRSIEKSKICYHPEASATSCDVDGNGKIKVSAAHSIQNNGVLSQVAEKGHVMGIALDRPGFEGDKMGKRLASIFWGFCNKHDAIFYPIETEPYTGTDEQHFLFAYRAFTVATHKKVEVSNFIDFGEQAGNDLKMNRSIFDSILLNKEYSRIKTDVIELPNFYPIAAASFFYLDYDFETNEIPHSEERMEGIFVTLLPQTTKTLFLISYFSEDESLYSKVSKQINERKKAKSDISILLAPHAENIYFNPTYYETFIEEQEEQIEKAFFEAQFDFAKFGEDNVPTDLISFTADNYLQNLYGINLFGY